MITRIVAILAAIGMAGCAVAPARLSLTDQSGSYGKFGAFIEAAPVIVEDVAPCGLGCRLRNLFSGGRDDGFGDLPEVITASRSFSARDEMDPADFAGYGIVYFPGSIQSGGNADRARMICQAFRQLPTVSDLETPPESIPRSDQFVTVWPLRLDSDVDEIRDAEGDEVAALRSGNSEAGSAAAARICGVAVASYDRNAANRAQRDAGGNAAFSGQGPYLLAWAPGAAKGADALVLSLDMSQVNTLPEARRDLTLWANLIEGDRSVWRNGFSLPRLSLALRRWVDGTSSSVLKVLG